MPSPGDLAMCRNCRMPIEYHRSGGRLLGDGWYHVDDRDDEPMYYVLCRDFTRPRAEPVCESL